MRKKIKVVFIKDYTPENIEKVLQEAYEEGYADGYEEGYNTYPINHPNADLWSDGTVTNMPFITGTSTTDARGMLINADKTNQNPGISWTTTTASTVSSASTSKPAKNKK